MQIRIHFPLPSSGPEAKVLRFIALGEHETTDNCLLFNGGPGDYRSKLFAIHTPLGNFTHCLGILWSEGEHTVLDDACDANLLDSIQVEESEATEDSCRLGNASEPFDIDGLSVVEILPAVWQADWQFCYALGQANADPTAFETGADVTLYIVKTV